jgi:hypothetical protein
MKATLQAYRNVLLSEQNSIIGDNDFTVKLPELSSGIYFLKVNNPNGQVISKLVKE